MLLLFVLLFAIVTNTFALDDIVPFMNQTIPENGETEGRIINGQAAAIGQFPWQVGIFYSVNQNGQTVGMFCGGALISSRHVCTAAHCVINGYNFQVLLGATRIDVWQETTQMVAVAQASYHENYNPSNLNNDVAVLTLAKDVSGKNIQIIRLSPSNLYLSPNTPVRASGWGRTESSNGVVNQLNWVDLVTMSNSDCSTYYNPGLVINSNVCCDFRNQKSICQGDSGGPVVWWNGNEYIHVATVSFTSGRGCAAGPSGYARTASFIPYYRRVTGINFP